MFTDGQEHPTEWFDEHLADVYTPVFVDESNFESEKGIGLWIRTDIYAVQDGDEKITYRYYNDDGILIRAETIPVVYNGENAVVFDSDDESQWAAGSYIGELGFRNGHFYVWDGSKWALQTTATIDDIPPSPKYLGCYTKPPENANEDDWYLNSTNGITYKFDGAEWNAVTDYDDSANTSIFMAEMSDLCALAKNTGESLFLERLCANVAFIGKLFSKNIVMQSGGSIKSENYVAGKSGWQIKSNGSADFMNINISGQATFYGDRVEASGKLRLPIVSQIPSGLGEGYLFYLK